MAGLGELATVMRCDRSNVSRLTERVASRGLVARHGIERDRRVKVVRLSDEGQRVVDAFTERLESRLQAVVAELPEGDRDQAARMLSTLTDALNRGPASAEGPPEPPPGAHLIPPG
jgi:DNA-binding MarR family transcriptional regulator